MATDAEFYQRTAERIARQDLAINHRLTWGLTSQSVLFAAYGLSFSQLPLRNLALGDFRKGVGVLGVLLGLACLSGVLGALLAIKQLRADWFARIGGAEEALEAGFPKLTGHGLAARLGFTPVWGVPLVFTATWVIVLCCR